MEPGSLTWVGSPCGLHGPYTFYKAFRFNLDRQTRLLSLGDFFVVRCGPGEPLCVAELQLLWEERTGHQLLSSSKLYFLPEDTPQGRSAGHGEDEVIAVSQKVVVRLEDLVKWTVWDHQAWKRGMKALPLKISTVNTDRSRADSFLRYHDSTLNCGLHFKDVLKEKAALGEGVCQKQVLVLSYPRYCRYCSVVARLREQPRFLLTNREVLALGGIAVPSENTHILYCRDTFHHPTLLHHESICEEFAPNLKGRPRKKKPSNFLYRDSQGQSQGLEVKVNCQTSLSETTAGETTLKVTADKVGLSKPKGSSNGSSCINHSSQVTTLALSKERRGRGRGLEYRAEEQAFLVSLYKYMKERKTPIERIPYLGFKQINLWTMFQAAQKLGGYELITARRQWKNIYDELGGNPGSTSAATCTRRHYERLILAYERFIRGEEDKPLPQFKARKQEAGSSTESSNSICTPILKTKACPKDQDHSSPELIEEHSQLKLEPQICITRLDSLQTSHSIRKRQQPTQDCSSKEIQPMLQLEDDDEVKRKRRCSGCEPSFFKTSTMTNYDKSVSPLATPKVFNHANSAVDLWQNQQVPLQDQYHVEKSRNLQSPTIPEPPSEQAELPRTDDSSLGFTTLYDSSKVSKGIMSPLAKKKLLLQVNSTGPDQDHSPFSFCQPPPLITSRSTSHIMDKATERPGVAADSSVVVLGRPSVIQQVKNFMVRVQKDRARKIKESTPPPLYPHEHNLHDVPTSHCHHKGPKCPSTLLLTPKIPRSSWTPQGFQSDLFSSFSHLHCWYRAAEKADGTVHAELIHDRSKHPQEQGATLSRDPGSLVGFPQSADASKYSTSTDQDKTFSPRTAASDNQPTDLSLPKSSIKLLHQPYTSFPVRCSTRYQESTQVLSHNGLAAVNIAHYSRARQGLPLTVSLANTLSTRQDQAVEPYTKATKEAVTNNKMSKLTHSVRPVLGSQVVLHNICVAQPLNKLGNSISKNRRQAVPPTPKDAFFSSPSRNIKTPKELDDSFVVESAEGAEGGAAASPFSLLNPASPQIYPNTVYPAGTLALSQVQNLCRDTLSIPLTMDNPHSSDSLLQNPVQYLKPQSTDFVHSSITQRQLLAQAAASPIHIYQQTYGDVLHHRLYSVSESSQPTFGLSQLNSVHPSTKLP